MRGAQKLALALALVALLATGLGACGGGDSDDSTADSGADPARESTAASTTEDRASSSGGNSSADEGSASFRTPGGDNSIQNFGDEADAAEIDAATVVLIDFLRARAEDDWAKECTLLARSTVAPLEQLASRSQQFKDKGCAAILAALVSGAPTSARANTLTGPIASLRVEGDRGFALYHGARGVDYFIPMVKEDGEWKVGSLAPSEFP